MALEQAQRATHALDGGGQDGAAGPPPLVVELVEQLQRVADVLGGRLGGPGTRVPAAPIQRAAPLGTTAPVHDMPLLRGGGHDLAPPRLRAPISPAATVDEKTSAGHCGISLPHWGAVG